jgi:uncharacterized membrane protein/mono/diheme cytochrome c family protein
MLALVAALARGWAPDGRERGTLLQFLGRFHPVLVHLPIALLALVPILEIAGSLRNRTHLRSSAGFVLWLAAFGSAFAALDGWLLARNGGYGGAQVIRHMWSGVWVAGLATAAAAVRPANRPLAYWTLLLGAMAMMAWTGHLGGNITHGEGYLTEFMPARLRAVLHMQGPPPKAATAPARAAAATAYAVRIAPLLDRSCVSCHNPRRAKGGLRLDTYALLMRGGEDGPVVVPWDPSRSELVRRVTLPASDEDAMPGNGRLRLTDAEVKILESWIAAGASPEQPLATLR